MNKRTVSLTVVLMLIGVGYLVLFNSRQIPPIEAMYVELPGARPIFSFNDELTFEEIKVVRPGVEPPEGEVYVAPEDEVVWHLIRREPREGREPPGLRPTDNITYGRGMRGLRRAQGIPRRGVPLEPGVTYMFTATLAEGEGTVEFEFTPKAEG
ncbi:MAG: hypothetical protein AAGH99_07505 [Planctomycetota bacterium]